jgi:putative ABC transport system permease protein
MISIRRILLKLWRRRRLQRDLEAELAFHRELSTRHANPIPFGNVTRIQEDALDLWRFAFIEDFCRDFMYAIRSLRRTPGFSAIAILTLAGGIGANTAIFTLLDRVMLESLPVRQPSRLIELLTDRGGGPGGAFSYQALEYFRDHTELCSSIMGVFSTEIHVLIDGDSLQRLRGQFVTGNYFTDLGVDTIRGRPITAEDDRTRNTVAVISHSMWQERFGGDTAAIGKTLMVENVPFTIVGVAPAVFQGVDVGRPVDVWVPLESERRIHRASLTSSAASKWLRLIARVKPGVPLEKAAAELRVLFNGAVIETEIASRRGSPRFNEFEAERIRKWSFSFEPAGAGLSATRRDFFKPLLVLMGIVGVLLLIACSNVANLLFVRALAREKEVALRLSLGAGRLRVVRQLLTESLVLAIAGGAIGLATAYFATKSLAAFLATSSPPLIINVAPNATVLAFTGLVAIGTALLFGLLPAFRGTRTDFASTLKGSAGAGRRSAGNRWTGILIVAQVALLTVLVVAAGLFIRTLHNLNSTDLGFDRNNVLLVRFDPFGSGHSPEQLRMLTAELLERFENLPGVKTASLDMFPPVSGGSGINFDFVINREGGVSTQARNVYVNIVSRNYFATLSTPVVAGRDFSSQKSGPASRTAIVNQTFARRYFGNVTPIGKTLMSRGAPLEIIGVAGDTKYEDVRQAMQPTVYFDAFEQGVLPPDAPVTTQYLIRTELDPTSIAPAVRNEIRSLLGNVAINERTLTDHIDASLARERLVTALAALFGGLALLLAVIGLYGVVSNSVARRRKEIGIRIALGFESRAIVSMVLREVFVLVGSGLALGLPLAVLVTRMLESLLYGLAPDDPATVVAAVAALLFSALAAGFIPARRASRLDAIVVLRTE